MSTVTFKSSSFAGVAITPIIHGVWDSVTGEITRPGAGYIGWAADRAGADSLIKQYRRAIRTGGWLPNFKPE